MKELKEMTVKELKEMAKEMKISNWWNLKKDVLIAKIEERQNMSDEEKQAIADQKAKEDAAIREYTKHWGRYTKRYNVLEFIEKWRAGEIVLDGDQSSEEVEEPVEEEPIEESVEEVEDVEEDQPEETPEPETEEKPVEKPKPKRGALIEYDGKAQNICKWGEELGISPNTLYGRIYKMGWSVERAFTTPSRKTK
jgi:transcription termination factor Rho|nr:MAG TPA: Rho termination factor, N-terminal domain [Caudoviricetes sp.]